MRFFRLSVCAGITCMLSLVARHRATANVSLKNGNFFVVYTDIVYPGGAEPKVERVYNSKASFRGMFGPGWGNEYEMYVHAEADGAVVVHEYGGGAENRFTPPQISDGTLGKLIERIANASKTTGDITSSSLEREFVSKLRSDAGFRERQWEAFRGRGILPAAATPVGTVLRSNRFGNQVLTRVPEGYIRTYEAGRTECFNDEGRLLQVSDPNGNTLTLRYAAGKIMELSDNLGRGVEFVLNAKGLMAQLKGFDGRTATFRYNEQDELVESSDVEANHYAYTYSDDGRHNLTRIAYDDGTTMEMAYHGKDKHYNIRSVKDRDGTLTEYDYDVRSADHYKVVANVSNNAQHVSSSSYEYFLGHNADGTTWTQRLVTSQDGDTTDTVYDQKTGNPETIARGGEITRFRYDEHGRVIYKDTPSETTTLEYDPQAGKVAYVKHELKRPKSNSSWSRFRYDSRGNLIYAEDSEHRTATLKYDSAGRIDEMVGQDNVRFRFSYNETSKPVEIRRINPDGTSDFITVTYTESGEIRKVESPGGRAIAVAVTSSFQNLLDLIRPAGVTLDR